MNESEALSRVLRDAIQNNVVDVSLNYLEHTTLLCMQYLEKNASSKPPFISLDQNPEALRTQVHTFGRTTIALPAQDNIFELARIVVPENNIGYLENVEQYLADKDGQFYATASTRWGQPYNETVDVNAVRWVFRIQDFTGQQPEQFFHTAVVIPDFINLLPGRPWSEINEIPGLWYPATQYHGIRANIAPANMLRLFVFIPRLTDYNWRAAATLTARVQSSICKEAHFNTRTTFQ